MLRSACCRSQEPWPARYARCAVQFCNTSLTAAAVTTTTTTTTTTTGRPSEEYLPEYRTEVSTRPSFRSVHPTCLGRPTRIPPFYRQSSITQRNHQQNTISNTTRTFFTDSRGSNDGHDSHGGHSHGSIADLPKDAKARRITWIGLWSNVALTAVKGGVGAASGSTSLVADAIHSASDLVSDCVALVAIKVSHRPRDASQPYGYGHYENIGTLAVSGLLIAAGLATGNHALEHLYPLLDPNSVYTPMTMVPAAIACAGASVVVKEILYRKTVTIGQELHSSVLVANAWHHRTDAFSSVVALVGTSGAALGFPFLDPVGGLLVAGMIIKVAVDIGSGAAYSLTDRQTEMDRKLVEGVKQIGQRLAQKTRHEIVDIHAIRCRHVGHYTLLDLHITVDPRISVTAAYQSGRRVKALIQKQYTSVADVFVHVQPAKREPACFSATETTSSSATSATNEHSSFPHSQPLPHQQQPAAAAATDDNDTYDDDHHHHHHHHHLEVSDDNKTVSQFKIQEDIESALRKLNDKSIISVSHVSVHYTEAASADNGILTGVEVNLEMDPTLTLSEAEKAARQAHHCIEYIAYIDFVDVHIEVVHDHTRLGLWSVDDDSGKEEAIRTNTVAHK